MKIIALFLLLISTVAASAQNNLLWELKPGVTERGKKPETWTLELREGSPEKAATAAKNLSSRLYGRSEAPLHHPLVFKTDFSSEKIFAFELDAVSSGGSDLIIKVNDAVLRQLKWPPASATRKIRRVIYFPLPKGNSTVSLEISQPSGVVVINRYLIADTLEQIPSVPQKTALNDFPAEVSGDKSASVKPPFTGDVSRFDDGYRGIWFTLGQKSEYGDKYSGGLGTYTANHLPIAIYSPEVNKTFFVYGGTIKGQRHLLIMASYFDHAKNVVPRPTIVHDKQGVNDPHDNPSLALDDKGYVWIFISGRGRARPGFKYRSKKPYDVSDFQFVEESEFTYPQPHFVSGKGFFHLFTKYTAGRELYWETSEDGFHWSEDHKLAGLEGHYQVSNADGAKIGTFFNRHPEHSVDKRTDLYYVQTADWGKTWTTVDGKKISVPLTQNDNPERVIDYSAQGKLMYTIDLNFDRNGNPVLLYITSRDFKPGPGGGPREWTVTKWNGKAWETSVVCTSDHNYDFGSMFLGDKEWTIFGTTEPGPQPWGAGGEIALWVSNDKGATWTKRRQITHDSKLNHSYVRRPLNAKDPFYVFWADGNPNQPSESHLYFGNSTGERYWQLPYDMKGRFVRPVEVMK